MRALVAIALVLAAMPLAIPSAPACHPPLHLATPTDPVLFVDAGSSCDHERHDACVEVVGSLVGRAGGCASSEAVLP